MNKYIFPDDYNLTKEELELYFELTRARIKYIEEKALAKKAQMESKNTGIEKEKSTAVDLSKFELIINKMPPEMQEEMMEFLRDFKNDEV